MENATHTPGPWYWDKVSTGHCRHVIVDSEGFTIANPSPMSEADARLIAAAPAMLAALQTIAFDENCEMLQAIKLAKETLAKVTA